MSEKCPKCDGKKRILNYYFYCPECDEEITKYERTPQDSKNTFNDIITYTCPKCGKEVSGVLNDLSFEERVSLCPCSQEALVRKLFIKDCYIAGHLPEIFWDRDISWYIEKTNKDIGKLNFYKDNKDIIEEIQNFSDQSKLLSIYNVFWLQGQAQSGATSLAVILAKNLIGNTYKNLYFISMYSFIERSKNFEDRTYVQRLLNYDIIIFDDCFTDGKVHVKSDFLKAQLYNFFKEAILANKIIICVSKIGIEDINSNEKGYGAIQQLLEVNAYKRALKKDLRAILIQEKEEKVEAIKAEEKNLAILAQKNKEEADRNRTASIRGAALPGIKESK